MADEAACQGQCCCWAVKSPPLGVPTLSRGLDAPTGPCADLAQLAETHAEEKKIVLEENELLRNIIVHRLASTQAAPR